MQTKHRPAYYAASTRTVVSASAYRRPIIGHVNRARHAVYIALTRKSSPDDFNRAQSNGLCPGARATLFLFFDGLTGAVVVDGGSANDETPG